MLRLNELLALWDFESHPFETYTAESEPRLSEYFVEPPYLDDVIGRPTAPTPAVVFGSRGLGKSAIRLFLESKCLTSDQLRAIAVTYDSFDIALADGLAAVTLDKHLRAILQRMTCAVLARIATWHRNDYGDVKPSSETIRKLFPQLDFDLLAKLVARYYSPLPDIEKEKAFRSVSDYFETQGASIEDRMRYFQRIWSYIRAPMFDIINLIQSVRGSALLLPPATAERAPSSPDTISRLVGDMEALAALAPQLHFDGWYVLVDKVDETSHTDSSASDAATLVLPMLKSLSLLEIPRVGIKFFLWDQVRPIFVRESVRLDKIRNWTMSWTYEELCGMVDARLQAFSRGRVSSLHALVGTDVDLYRLAIDLAMSSPRELVQILDAVFREHARRSTHEDGAMITLNSLELGLDEYSKRRCSDLYAKELIASLSRLPRSKFTSAEIQSVFRISQPAASTKLNNWISNGLVERIEDVRSQRDPSKFVHQYEISERRLRRIVDRRLEGGA